MRLPEVGSKWTADGLRFLIAGGTNTAVTVGVYQLLLFVAPAWLAYSLSWICGLLFVMVFYPARVFPGGRRDLSARASLGITYVAVFLVGLGTLRMLTSMGMMARWSIFVVLALTTLTNFIIGRLILRGSASSYRFGRDHG